MQSRSQSDIRGIDVSNWKGSIDFLKVKNDGIKVVYIKASEGTTYKDKFLDQNYDRAKAQGLKIGFYHFFRGNAVLEAKHFVDCISGKDTNCLLALDVEVTNSMDKATLTSACIEFLEEVKKLTGKGVIVYTYTSFARDNLDTRLGKYPCWIAQYGVNAPQNNPIWNNWTGFQYTENGNISGVNGGCDVDDFKQGIFLREEKKVKDIVIYSDGADERAANYLADFLQCPTISNSRKFDYSCVENVYAVGGNKKEYTSFLKTLISGNNRYTTMQAVLNYIKEHE